jgi:hypothetical protein
MYPGTSSYHPEISIKHLNIIHSTEGGGHELYTYIKRYNPQFLFYLLHIPTIVTTGSNNLFSSTCVQFLSVAPGASGEQGVNRSSIITLGSSLEGPRT